MDPTTLKTEPLVQKENKKPIEGAYKLTIALILLFTPYFLFLAYLNLSDLRNFIVLTSCYILLATGLLFLTAALTNEIKNPSKARKWGRVSGILFFIMFVVLPLAGNEWWKMTGREAVDFWVAVVFGFVYVVAMHVRYFVEPVTVVFVNVEDGSLQGLLPPEKMV